MLGGEIVVTKDDLESLSRTESATLNKLIRDDFIAYYEEMKDFDLSKLLEYRLSHKVMDSSDNGYLNSQKNSASLKFLDNENDKIYNLNIEFDNVDY